ncbi:MAG: GNAT family N-acetyltransferase [Anaerolineae bacterium]|nr:GNAT family N-acetyltransferase [Anaerolineae bacterium]
MDITLYHDNSFFNNLREEWDELLANSEANQIFLTHTWLSTWWEAYQPGVIWGIVVRDHASGQLNGIAPWFISTSEDGTQIVCAIGCVDVTDYLDVIIRQGCEREVLTTLAEFIEQQTDTFDQITLCNIPHGSYTLELFPSLLEERNLHTVIEQQDVCPVITLPERWTDYIASLSKKNRHELRRKLRRAGSGQVENEAAETIDWYIVGSEHNLDTQLDLFLKLMAASNDDKATFLQNPANQAFFRLIVPRLARQGWLQLAFFTVNGQAAATYLNFDYANRIMVYNSGHKPDSHGHLSPGIVLLARLIKHAIEQEREAFDFLRGNEPYKYDMGGHDTQIYQLVVKKASEEET